MPEQGFFNEIFSNFDVDVKKSMGPKHLRMLSIIAGFDPNDSSISNEEALGLISSVVLPYAEIMNSEYPTPHKRVAAGSTFVESQLAILMCHEEYQEANPVVLKRSLSQALNFFKRQELYLPENYQKLLNSQT